MQDLPMATSPDGSPLQKKRKRLSRRVPIDMVVQLQIAAVDQPKDREALKKRLRKQITCCEINEITTSGLTALNQCVLDGNLESAKMLVELGANVNKKDRFGWTALHYAASEGYEEICRFLLRCGANVRAEDKEGKFPVEVTDDESILKILLRATLLYNMPPLDKDSLQHSCWCAYISETKGLELEQWLHEECEMTWPKFIWKSTKEAKIDRELVLFWEGKAADNRLALRLFEHAQLVTLWETSAKHSFSRTHQEFRNV